ncbi:hypothetical protein EVAR_70734_1 [Eumeta japonica]|uniref:Uncharacterized protein n=1 Tax=Eumeta variegata TaxID=151549 RepID=A0A4C1SMP5_EUMVA|nr:hypothetical protein EVAR_70734_1 [Eumeta japonica]
MESCSRNDRKLGFKRGQCLRWPATLANRALPSVPIDQCIKGSDRYVVVQWHVTKRLPLLFTAANSIRTHASLRELPHAFHHHNALNEETFCTAHRRDLTLRSPRNARGPAALARGRQDATAALPAADI